MPYPIPPCRPHATIAPSKKLAHWKHTRTHLSDSICFLPGNKTLPFNFSDASPVAVTSLRSYFYCAITYFDCITVSTLGILSCGVGLPRKCVCVRALARWTLLMFAHCHSGAYNNAGLVSVRGVITANVPPPPYNSAHKVAGMIGATAETACVCLGQQMATRRLSARHAASWRFASFKAGLSAECASLDWSYTEWPENTAAVNLTIYVEEPFVCLCTFQCSDI